MRREWPCNREQKEPVATEEVNTVTLRNMARFEDGIRRLVLRYMYSKQQRKARELLREAEQVEQEAESVYNQALDTGNVGNVRKAKEALDKARAMTQKARGLVDRATRLDERVGSNGQHLNDI